MGWGISDFVRHPTRVGIHPSKLHIVAVSGKRGGRVRVPKGYGSLIINNGGVPLPKMSLMVVCYPLNVPLFVEVRRVEGTNLDEEDGKE